MAHQHITRVSINSKPFICSLSLFRFPPSGHETHPVTCINWRDAIVWCNALTEYYNWRNPNGTPLDCVYEDSQGKPIRSSKDGAAVCDALVDPNVAAKGFRLPTSLEWELAARYINGSDWTDVDWASGAAGPYTDDTATKAVAWYTKNSGGSTHPVGQKKANSLWIYDMSGNVWEWCFDLEGGSGRVWRGGGWRDDASNLRVGMVDYGNPDRADDGDLGFCPVRTE